MSNTWQVFATFPDVASAEVTAGLLRGEDVPVEMTVDEPIPGLINSVRLSVPADLMHRAKWLTSQAPLTEAELTFLATGKLESDNEQER